MKIYKHSFDHISIDSNISLFDIDIDFYIKDDMDLSITIQDIGMILLNGIEYDSIDHKTVFNKLEEYYRKNDTLDVILNIDKTLADRHFKRMQYSIFL